MKVLAARSEGYFAYKILFRDKPLGFFNPRTRLDY